MRTQLSRNRVISISYLSAFEGIVSVTTPCIYIHSRAHAWAREFANLFPISSGLRRRVPPYNKKLAFAQNHFFCARTSQDFGTSQLPRTSPPTIRNLAVPRNFTGLHNFVGRRRRGFATSQDRGQRGMKYVTYTYTYIYELLAMQVGANDCNCEARSGSPEFE